MNPDLRIKFDPAEVGAVMAHATDEEQAVAINAFAEELLRISRTQYAVQMQLRYIEDRITKRVAEILEWPQKTER